MCGVVYVVGTVPCGVCLSCGCVDCIYVCHCVMFPHVFLLPPCVHVAATCWLQSTSSSKPVLFETHAGWVWLCMCMLSMVVWGASRAPLHLHNSSHVCLLIPKPCFNAEVCLVFSFLLSLVAMQQWKCHALTLWCMPQLLPWSHAL